MFAIYVRKMLGKVSGGRGGPKQKQREWVYQEEGEAPPKDRGSGSSLIAREELKILVGGQMRVFIWIFQDQCNKYYRLRFFLVLEAQGTRFAFFWGYLSWVDGCHPVSHMIFPMS